MYTSIGMHDAPILGRSRGLLKGLGHPNDVKPPEIIKEVKIANGTLTARLPDF